MARNFKRRGGPTNLTFFSSVLFIRQNQFEADCETEKALGKSGACSPEKVLKNLHAVMAVLVLFEQFLGKLC